MELEKCKRIIKYNIKEKKSLDSIISMFYEKCDLQYGEQLLFDSWNVVNLVANKLKTLSLFLPMKDTELGAVCYYRKKSISYLFINSSIPEANMRFAFCHELYHLLKPSETIISKGLDMYLDTEYSESSDEMFANAFAGAILMPEQKFVNKCKALGDIEELEKVVRLSDIFGAPYVSVVIRCYELNVLTDMSKLHYLLQISKDQLEDLYNQYWLNSELLKPKKIDQFNSLCSLVSNEANLQLEDDELSQYDKDYILNKLQQLYQKIKG